MALGRHRVLVGVDEVSGLVGVDEVSGGPCFFLAGTRVRRLEGV